MKKGKQVVRDQIATWWRISRHKAEIEPLKVVAFTGGFVTYLVLGFRFEGPSEPEERRESRDDVFPTFAEAKAEAVRRAQERVESAKRALHQRRTELGMFESLKDLAPLRTRPSDSI